MRTPGVYIKELDSSSNFVTPVETAVPAFIGYTPKASFEGKSYENIPVKITSYQDFMTYFCLPDPAPPSDPTKQYSPDYYLVAETAPSTKGDFINVHNGIYAIVPDPGSIYYLVNSIRAFYDNGGGDAYIVSVGEYGEVTGVPMQPGEQVVNPNVQLEELKNGLEELKQFREVTLYICPEATLLAPEANEKLMQLMLEQCDEMQTAMCIFDIIGANDPDSVTLDNDIESFRNSLGMNGLKFGAAYYPFLESTTMRNFDFTNLNGGDIEQLKAIISPANAPDAKAEKIIEDFQNNNFSISRAQQLLMNQSPTYRSVYEAVLKVANVLPPSGFMAGIYTRIDNSQGVWKAPANVTPIGAANLTINLKDAQQSSLSEDPVSGKSINCIRSFSGQGILVWGARTLDGNSQDWRYISVRRTVTLIEQSCKVACEAYVFQPNDKNTWESVKAMLNSFLTGLWNEGALIGARASDAYSVEVGLGSTMTSDDILNGRMIVMIKVALTHPVEFMVISFEQEMSVA